MCVLDAAVLLQAKWDTGLNEVWVSIVPVEEASLSYEPGDVLVIISSFRL